MYRSTEFEQAFYLVFLAMPNKMNEIDTIYKKSVKSEDHFWCTMRQAVVVMQASEGFYDKKLNSLMLTKSAESLIVLSQKNKDFDHKNPHKTYCYVSFGLWYFLIGDHHQAKVYIQEAIQADNVWGYPEYLMGWLTLFDSSADPVQHFINAIKYNWTFFHAINNNKLLGQYPVILKKIRQKLLIK